MKITPYIILLIALAVILQTGCNNSSKENKQKEVDAILKKAESLDPNDSEYFALADSARLLSSRLNYHRGEAKAITLKGSHLYSNKLYKESLEEFEKALAVSQKFNNKEQSANLYDKIALVYNRFKEKETCINYFKKSVELRKELKDSVGLGSSLNNIGFIFWQSSQFDSALIYFEKALNIRRTLGNKEFTASTANNMGTIYFQWSVYDKALEYYLISLKFRKEINDPTGIALTYSNIGLVYSESAQKGKALEYFREGLAYSYISRDSQAIGYAYHCLGGAFININADSALNYFNQSYRFYSSIGETGGIILALKGLGDVYLNKNELSKARYYFKNILNLAEESDTPLRISESYKYLGEINKRENNLAKAEEYLLESIKISERINVKTILRDAYKILSETQELRGNIDGALSSLKQFERYKFNIEDDAMQRRLAALKNNFEFEKYQRNLEAQQYENEKQKILLIVTCIAVLFLSAAAFVLIRLNRRKNQINILLNQKKELIEGQSSELALKNEELRESNTAKDKFFSIVAHDLKNPFFVLINLSSILEEDYYELSESEKLEIINNIEQTSRKTYDLLENLLNLSASRTGRIDFNPIKIDLNELSNKVIDLYSSELKKKHIRAVKNISGGLSIYADPTMVEIIIRNLFNNAVKYSRQESEIIISADEEDESIIISIEDSGIGMDKNTLENIFNINLVKSQEGTGGERGTGLGLGLCKEFIEKNNGEISVESEIGLGSKFNIKLPKYHEKFILSDNQ